MRIAVVNTKGGVGKTTTAVHLAAMLAEQGQGDDGPAATLLIDGDRQATAATWAAWRAEAKVSAPSPVTVCLAESAIFDEGRRLAAGFAHTVIDAGGRDSMGLRAALLLAEVAVVPVRATNFDSAALSDLKRITADAAMLNPGLRVRVLLSQVNPRTREVASMREHLGAIGVDVFARQICMRIAYPRATGDGLTVGELIGNARDDDAEAEMAAFFEELTQ